MLSLAVIPAGVAASAASVVVSDVTGTRAAKLVPWTAAGSPLTTTPTSAPPAFTVPRTKREPAGTVAFAEGAVIWMLRVPTAKLRWAGVGSSFPARSRALTSNRCEPGVRPLTVAGVAGGEPGNGTPSRRQAN